jgi:hypothetical protein
MFFAVDVYYVFEKQIQKKCNSRHVDECHNKIKDRVLVKEQVNQAQNSFLERGLHE